MPLDLILNKEEILKDIRGLNLDKEDQVEKLLPSLFKKEASIKYKSLMLQQ